MTLSITFGAILVILVVSGLLGFAIAYLRGANPDRLDKVFDVWKWTIGTVAIGVAASIVSDSFKQREADRNEMAAYNQYVNIVIDSGTVDKKQRLCDFFIAVSPAGRMRDSWIRYSETLNKATTKADILTKKENSIVKQIVQDKPTAAQLAALSNVQQQRQQVLSEVGAVESGPYFIISGGDKTIAAAKDQLTKAQEISNQVALYKKNGMFRTVFTGLSTKDAAMVMLQSVRSQLNAAAYVVKASSWCPNYNVTNDCVICNM